MRNAIRYLRPRHHRAKEIKPTCLRKHAKAWGLPVCCFTLRTPNATSWASIRRQDPNHYYSDRFQHPFLDTHQLFQRYLASNFTARASLDKACAKKKTVTLRAEPNKQSDN